MVNDIVHSSWLIEIKRDGGEFSEVDIEEFVSKLVSSGVSEAQLGAWLMATYIHGLSVQELFIKKLSH